MADALKQLENEYISPKEISTPIVVTVIGKGGYYPSKFKDKGQLAVLVNFKGIKRRLPINARSVKAIAMDVDFTMETQNWVGRKLRIHRRLTKAGGTHTIEAHPFRHVEAQAIVG